MGLKLTTPHKGGLISSRSLDYFTAVIFLQQLFQSKSKETFLRFTQVCWSQPQLSWGEDGVTSLTSFQFIAGPM